MIIPLYAKIRFWRVLPFVGMAIAFATLSAEAQSVEPFELASSFPESGADDVPVSIALQLRFGDAVKVDTLSVLELTKVDENGSRESVRIRAATDLTNASVTVVPGAFLDPDSNYELVGTSALQSRDGRALVPFTLSFRTENAEASSAGGLMFSKEVFDQNRSMTTVIFGPDRRLYAADAFGSLIRWDLDEKGRPINRKELLSDATKSRQYIDLEWDPKASSRSLVLWASYGERTEFEEPRRYFTGTISKLTIKDDSVEEEVVVKGLPHGREKQGGFETLPHQPNGLVFRGGKLYQSIGSTSSSGGPSNWGVEEQLLSACIVEIDYKKIKSPLDTHPSTGYDPYARKAPVRLFATGVRNALEIVAHSNGNLYTAVNINDRRGAADGVPDDPDIEGNQNLLVKQTTPDHESLYLLRKGRYYGFPNPSRDQFVLSGGNPTAGSDPFEISDYPVGTQPEKGFAPELMYPIWHYGGTSPNGMIEYLPEFDHPLRHALICCFYSAGDIAVMPLGKDGLPTSVEKLRGESGKLSFNGPLDITMDPQTGILYVTDFGTQNKFGSDGSMALLRPIKE